MTWLERMARRFIPHRVLSTLPGAPEGSFTRFDVFVCRWFSIHLHRVDEPSEPVTCHDHPWHFWTLILAGGYWERINGTMTWRRPGTILYRTARSLHNVVTRPGRPVWSLVFKSRKVRKWGHKTCE